VDVNSISTGVDYLLPSKKVSVHLWSVGRIAMMMRKFEKAGSDNYKKSLQYVFDKNQAISQLKHEEIDTQLSMTDRLVNLVYFVRKFEITWEELKTIYMRMDFLKMAKDSLKPGAKDSDSDTQISYWFSLALKYLSGNSATYNSHQLLSPGDVLALLEIVDDNAVKIELVWTLSYILASLSNDPRAEEHVLTVEIIKKINVLAINNVEISDEVKAFLLSHMITVEGGVSNMTNEQSGNDDFTNSTAMVSRPKVKKQAIVSKTTQMVKSSVKNQQGDDIQIKILNLANALKGRSRKTIAMASRQHYDKVDDKLGDDRSMWRSTWPECLNLYNLSRTGSKTLKKDDKDNYLPAKLFGTHFQNTIRITTTPPFSIDVRPLYEFFINRMIVAAFKNICEQQELNGDAVDALLKGVTQLNQMPNVRPFKSLEKCTEVIVGYVCADYKTIEGLDGPDLMKRFYDEIKDKIMRIQVKKNWLSREYQIKVPQESYNKDEVRRLVKKQLETMRLEIAEILYTSACRNTKILTKSRVQIIKDYITSGADSKQDEEEEFQSKLLEIMGIVNESDSGIDFKELFGMYLNILTTSNSLQQTKQAVNFMIRETRDPERCKALISDVVLAKLMQLLQGDATGDTPSAPDEVKVLVLEVINNYVEHEYCVGGLSDGHLWNLVRNIVVKEEQNTEMTEGVLMSILLTANKRHTLPRRLVSKLIELLDKSYGDFILVILSHCEEQTIDMERDLELLSEKLCSDYVVVETEGKMVKIEKMSDSNAGSTSIALLAAQLLLKAFQGSIAVKQSKENETKSKSRFGSMLYNSIKDVLVALAGGSSPELTAVTDRTLQNLIVAVDGNADKQVKLVSTKCMYLLSVVPKQALCQFSKEVLNTLHSQVNSEDFVISTYSRAAYLRGLATLSQQKEPLPTDFMDSISYMYVIQGSMRIGDHDCVPEINEHVLMILASEAPKVQRFEDEELFQVFEQILYENKNTEYSIKVKYRTSSVKACSLTTVKLKRFVSAAGKPS